MAKTEKPKMTVLEEDLPQTKTPSSNQNEKLSYEQLANAANQLHQQNQMLMKQMQQMQMQMHEMARAEQIQAIGFAFKVLEHREHFEDAFVRKMIKAIEETLTPEEPKEAPKETKG